MTAPKLSSAEAQELVRVVELAVKAARVANHHAEDVAQTVIEKVLKGWDNPSIAEARQRKPDEWRAYVTVMARNAARDNGRSNGRRVVRENRVARGHDGGPLPARPGVARSVQAHSYVDEHLANLALCDLIDTVETLSDNQRRAVRLHLVEGQSAVAIAVVLGANARTVRGWIQQARAKIRAEIERIECE